MSSAQSQRIQAYCEIIWGRGDYDIDIETDDWEKYSGVVKKDFGLEYGPPLTMTGLCNSSEQVWKELDRMLGAWATQRQTGQKMTKDQKLDIVGGPNGRNKAVLESFLAESERRGTKPA